MEGNVNLREIIPAKQDYAWGGTTYLAEFLGENEQQIAELWFGDHPKGPAKVIDNDTSMNLDRWLQNNHRSGLSFLLKLLDVQQMLSIQAHPTKEVAIQGFEYENKKGIPALDYHRIYRDKNPKPEMMVALSDFWLLHGFDTIPSIVNELQEYDELSVLQSKLGHGMRNAVEYILQLDQNDVNALVRPLARKLIQGYELGEFSKSQKHYWAAKACMEHNKKGTCDRGVLMIYLMNVVHLTTGESIFQPANLLHAYLEGQNVEIMINSDNVFRAGLTKKKLAMDEILKHVSMDSIEPQIIKKQSGLNQWMQWPSFVSEFHLAYVQLEADHAVSHLNEELQIWIVINGSGKVHFENDQYEIISGKSYILPFGKPHEIHSTTGLELYSAFGSSE